MTPVFIFRPVRGWTFLLCLCTFLFSSIEEKLYASGIDTIPHSELSDSARVNSLNRLAFYFRYNDPAKALEYSTDAYNIAKSAGYDYGLVYSLNHLGTLSNQRGELQKAISYYYQAASMATHDSMVLRGVALAINNLGLIHEQRGNFDLSLKYFKNALQIDSSLNYTRGIARELGNIGKVYIDLNKPDSAIQIIRKSIELDSADANIYSMTESWIDIGRAYILLDNYSAAESSFKRASQINNGKYKSSNAYISHYLGNLFRLRKIYDNALQHQVQAYNSAVALDEKELIRSSAFELSQLYKNVLNFEEAVRYMEIYNEVNIFLSDQKAVSLLADLQEKYETQKKEEEIRNLQRTKEKMLYYNTHLINFRNGLFMSLAFCMLLSGILYRAYRDKRKVNAELMRKFAQVRLMNEEIQKKSAEIEAKNNVILEANDILQRQRHQLSEAQRIARLGSWEYDLNKKEWWWSQQLLDMFRLPGSGETPGMSDILKKIHPDDRLTVIKSIRTLLKNHIPLDLNIKLNSTSGDIRYLSAKGIPILSRDNIVQIISGTVLDTTEQKLIEQSLVEARDQAELANKTKSMFLANMSHEIRTPLNGILGFADILLRESTDRQHREYLKLIRNSGDTLLILLNDILDFNKIEHGKLIIEEVNYKLRDLIEQAIVPYTHQAKEKGIEFKISVSPEVPEWIAGDPHRTRQLLVNFISNAIKFTSSGMLVVSVHVDEMSIPDGNQLKLKFMVSDTGIGVPADKQNDIFNLFTQADSSTTRKFGGTGLGLAISKQLSKLMGGDAGMASPGILNELSEQPGSDFWFTILIKRGIEVKTQNRKQVHKSNYYFTTAPRILVAEDNPINQLLMKKVLDSMNCRIEIVDNGQLALEALEKNSFEVILMDIQMPVMDGYQAVKKIREANNPIPVIGVSANVFRDDIEKSLESGMDAHIGKPFTAEELYMALVKFIPSGHSSGNS